MSLPHITNSKAGVNKWDPVHTNIFEVYFSLPEALRAQFGQDEALITEHVLSISGLGSLNRAPGVSQQKFMVLIDLISIRNLIILTPKSQLN